MGFVLFDRDCTENRIKVTDSDTLTIPAKCYMHISYATDHILEMVTEAISNIYKDYDVAPTIEVICTNVNEGLAETLKSNGFQLIRSGSWVLPSPDFNRVVI